MPRKKKEYGPVRDLNGRDLSKEGWKEANADIRTSSLWLLGTRGGSHGDNKFHGNFHPEIPRQAMLRYTREGDVVWDPFSGSGTTRSVARELGRRAIVSDVVPRHEGCTLGDARTFDPGEEVDLVILHPPYADIIDYEAGPGDLSLPVKRFVPEFLKAVENTSRHLKLGGVLVVVIADVQKDGFIPLGSIVQAGIMGLGNLAPLGNVIKNLGQTKRMSAAPGNIGEDEEDDGVDNGGGVWRYRALSGGFFEFKHEYVQFYRKVAGDVRGTDEDQAGPARKAGPVPTEEPKEEAPVSDEWDDWGEEETPAAVATPATPAKATELPPQPGEKHGKYKKKVFDVELNAGEAPYLYNAENMRMFWVNMIFERHRIWHRRFIQGLPRKEWTEDKIFQDNKFTNVYRELDKGTIVLLDHILDKGPDIEVFFNILLYRLVNNYDTWLEDIGYQKIVEGWKDKPWDRLRKRQEKGIPVWCTAHVVSGYPNFPGPDGKPTDSKIDKIHWMFDQIYKNIDDLWEKIQAADTFEQVYKVLLKEVNGYGPFLSYEVAVDLTYGSNPLILFTEDEWANAGPGAKRGISILFGEKLAKGVDHNDVMVWLRDNQDKFFTEYGVNFKEIAYRSKPMTLRNIEHCLCEFFKYYKVTNGAGKCRMRFEPTSTYKNTRHNWLERLKG